MPSPTVSIPALLCDEEVDRKAIGALGDLIDLQVLLPPEARPADSAAGVPACALERLVPVGASYGGLDGRRQRVAAVSPPSTTSAVPVT